MPRNANANVPAQSPTCICCSRTFNSRLTRSSVNDLCEYCFDEAGMENGHNDGHHDQTPDAHCPTCQNTDPHAGISARTASGNQGKVITATDGRLLANAPVVPEAAPQVKVLTFRGRATPLADKVGRVITRKTLKGVEYALVKVEGLAQVRWFANDDLAAVRAPRARRSRAASSEEAA